MFGDASRREGGEEDRGEGRRGLNAYRSRSRRRLQSVLLEGGAGTQAAPGRRLSSARAAPAGSVAAPRVPSCRRTPDETSSAPRPPDESEQEEIPNPGTTGRSPALREGADTEFGLESMIPARGEGEGEVDDVAGVADGGGGWTPASE